MWGNDDGRWYTREELFDLIWMTPIRTLAECFGLSDVALAKKCKSLAIPRPGRGHWARVDAGRTAERPELPIPSRGRAERVWIDTKRVEKAEPAKLSQEVADEIPMLREPRNRVLVRTDFMGAHKLIRSTRRLLRSGKVDDYGRVYNWDSPDSCLHINVSRQMLERTLLILDALLKALEKRKFNIATVDDKGRHGTYLMRGETKMSLYAFEKANRFDYVPTLEEARREKESSWRSYPKWKYKPSGEVQIVLTRWPLHELRWKDLQSQPLEERVTDIVAAVIESSELANIELAKQEEIEKQEVERRRLAEVRRRFEEEDLTRQRELIQQATDWEEASRVRTYLSAYLDSIQTLPGERIGSQQIAEWVEWVSTTINRIDPLTNGVQRRLMAKVLELSEEGSA